ncbi:hypothetical protein [Candidatus Liberibacter americanus]|uniref:Uncharacterized protein n=1 Tax=Candidatus Liberibacter americanus str. Sao Paulo TaxID=1261131 RepID=U6B7D7_9HYPH|nr:hypothetical protein [Candidatus Liberibacter americanus]AHA27766.1 hypothetical protein lam_399 [Candidatus Liberibacter americanus str. Sao Paulo]EMS36151.1 hypothetical protein G653_02861 [Candidatus Liberibacter americanus PW_SP]
MEIPFVNINIDRLKNIDNDFSHISRDKLSYGSFQSVLNDNHTNESSKDLTPVAGAMQKLQGIMFQYFIKSILPEETVKSLGGGFDGDFWKEILAGNISDTIIKQHKIHFNLHADKINQNTNFP